MASAIPPGTTAPPAILDSSSLPVAQLESLKFKIAQIIDSIQTLQWQLEGGGRNVMPPWPDILAKYNLLLSQTHNLSTTLIGGGSAQATSRRTDSGGTDASGSSLASNAFARLALHPTLHLQDLQFDNELIPLLRNNQTTEVLRLESDTVRRLSSRLESTKAAAKAGGGISNSETQASILRELGTIRAEHDSRCERAVRAVALLRDKYDWKARVAVETEEPEDFVPLLSPLHPLSPISRLSPVIPGVALPESLSGDVGDIDIAEDKDDDSGEDEEELEEVLGPSLQPSPGRDSSLASTPAS